MTNHDDQLGTVTEIMRDTRIAVLTHHTARGRPGVPARWGPRTSSTPSTVWFITERDTDKVHAIAADPRVNVSYSSKSGWVSLSGTARVNEDRDKLRELWDASAGIFMSGGPDDAGNVLLEVTGATAEYWRVPRQGLDGGRPGQGPA